MNFAEIPVGCLGKEQFRTKAEAFNKVRRQRGRGGMHGGNMAVYHCRTCGAFHVGGSR